MKELIFILTSPRSVLSCVNGHREQNDGRSRPLTVSKMTRGRRDGRGMASPVYGQLEICMELTTHHMTRRYLIERTRSR
jgi:hypothetical protein